MIKVDINNFEKVIPKNMASIFLRVVLYISIFIFSSTWFRIGVGVLFILDIIWFIICFKRYTKFWNIKNSQEKIVFKEKYDIELYAKLLGVDLEKDDEITIKRKYRGLSKIWNPDKFINDSIENQEIANRNFQRLNNAYNIIKKYKNIK